MTQTEMKLYKRVIPNLKEFKLSYICELRRSSFYRKVEVSLTDGFYDIIFDIRYYPGRHITDFTEELEKTFREKRLELIKNNV